MRSKQEQSWDNKERIQALEEARKRMLSLEMLKKERSKQVCYSLDLLALRLIGRLNDFLKLFKSLCTITHWKGLTYFIYLL